jgi:hypothetical protein
MGLRAQHRDRSAPPDRRVHLAGIAGRLGPADAERFGGARAEEGRFLDVESGAGAQRIFSLLNFTTIAKRMSLNFSDVFGRGISFDAAAQPCSPWTRAAGIRRAAGSGGHRQPLPRHRQRRSRAARLDNEMIVTLPVTRSLPWYAAYVALANPLAGIGVLVGERVLRKPLEQFSSARYRISGTLDDPAGDLRQRLRRGACRGRRRRPPGRNAAAGAEEPAGEKPLSGTVEDIDE